MANILEEKLREAACLGDLYALRTLISRNVNINSQNIVNGWTALHWAVKRGHEDAVRLLLQYGADPNIINNKEEIPARLSVKPSISKLLGKSDSITTATEKPDFIPGYIEHPPLFVDLLDLEPTYLKRQALMPVVKETQQVQPDDPKKKRKNDLIVRVRIENSDDRDYIEFEMPTEAITYQSLVKRCCEELEIDPHRVAKIKKGSVKLRNDADVRRFSSHVYLDLFVKY